jgi:hypothetical protein
MTKAKLYLILGGALTVFMLWDIADYFIGGLGFPRGDWETYAWSLPGVLFILLGLLLREKEKDEKSKQGGED